MWASSGTRWRTGKPNVLQSMGSQRVWHYWVTSLSLFCFYDYCCSVTQPCPTLCDPMDYTVRGILQARILDWAAFPFSRGSSQPGIEPRSPALWADSLPAEPQGKPIKTEIVCYFIVIDEKEKISFLWYAQPSWRKTRPTQIQWYFPK